MKLTKYFLVLLALIFAYGLAQPPTYAKDTGKVKLAKAMVASAKDINVNNIDMWVKNDGIFGSDPVTGQAGLYYPKGQRDKAVLYTGGLWVVGKINGKIRSAAADYATEYQPGLILPNGRPDDPTLPKYRVYKINKGDSADPNSPHYNKDYAEWPVDQGAPVDSAGNPLMIGDQVLYCVYNDFADHANVWQLPPIGLEVHQLVWGYNQTGPLGNTVFMKFTFINKSADTLKAAYVGLFADPDDGGANDDYVACDTTLSIGYVYNGDGYDSEYGSAVPAMAFDFFQGPIVPSPGDKAILPDGTVLQDQKILPMTAFAMYINGSSTYQDPALQSPDGAEQAYNYLQGLVWDGSAFKDPTTGKESKFVNSGDPVSGTGWLPQAVTPPKDMRMLLSSGPFDLPPNEPKSVVAGIVVGVGSDNLSSITVMKYYDQGAQIAYNQAFKVASPPPQPKVKVVQLDDKLVLTWDQAAVNFSELGYNFEGYNIYQGESASGPWHKIKTFDKVDNIATITDLAFNSEAGALVTQPVQRGTDSGLTFHFEVNKDYIHNVPLVNGRKYYFAVTGYAYNPNGVPKTLENTPKTVIAIPQNPVLDIKYNANAGDTIKVEHTGPSQGNVIVTVVDPGAITGDDYKVEFYTIEDTTSAHYGEVAWRLVDTTTGKILLNDQFHQGNDNAFPVVDGMLVKVAGPAPGLQAVVEVANPDFPLPNGLPEDQWDAKGAPFHGNNVWLSLSCPDDANLNGRFFFSYQGAYIGDLSKSHDYEIRWTADSSWATFAFTSGKYIKVPFQIWDTGFATPDDPSDDVQMIPVLYEDGGTPNVWDIPNGNAKDKVFGLPCSDRIYFYYVDNAPNGYADLKAACDKGDFKAADNMWGMVYNRPLGRLVVGNYTATGDPAAGTIVRFLTNKPNSKADQFTFSTKDYKKSQGLAVAKMRLKDINVFPNPYYGSNKAETGFYTQFVTFINLPKTCTIRIFSLAGGHVKTIKHNVDSPFEKWYLKNEDNIPVASGIYLAYIDVPNVGQKILKIAVINREQRYRHF